MSLKSRSINGVPHQRPAPLREDFHHPQPFRRRGRGRKIVVTGLRVARSKQPGGIVSAIGHFVSFHANVSVRKDRILILTDRRRAAPIFPSRGDRCE